MNRAEMDENRLVPSRTEVIVGIFVLLIFVAVLIPLVLHARKNARLYECRNNLKQVALGLHLYADVRNSFPAGTFGRLDLPPGRRWSWYPSLYPFLGSIPSPEIPWDEPWDEPENYPIQQELGKENPYLTDLQSPQVLLCPNLPSEGGRFGVPATAYVGMSGVGTNSASLSMKDPNAGFWGFDRASSLEEQRRGNSNTIVLIETVNTIDTWLAGGPATVRGLDDRKPVIGSDGQFGGLHSGGCPITLTDASVSVLSESIELSVLKAMCTTSGEDP